MRPSHFDPMMLTPSQIAYPLDFLSRSPYFKYNKSNDKQQDDAATMIPAHSAIANFYITCLINKLWHLSPCNLSIS